MATYEIKENSTQEDIFSKPDKPQTITIHSMGKNLFESSELVDNSAAVVSDVNNTTTINLNDGEYRFNIGPALCNRYVEREEEEKVNMDKFLDLKERDEKHKVYEKYESIIEDIVEKDEITQELIELDKKIKMIFDNYKEKYNYSFKKYNYQFTPVTKERLDKIEEERKNEYLKIEKKYKEIRALCAGANHSERMEIYKMYGLIEG